MSIACSVFFVKQVSITGVGGYVPPHRLTNKDLEGMVDTNDAWIVKRTGIRERRILREKDKAVSYIGIESVRELLRSHSVDPESIDLIICGTNTPDMLFPPTAIAVARATGLTRATGFDIQAACPSFLNALVLARQAIQSGGHRRVIVLGIDKMSAIVDYQDRTTCILFGDGGGAVLVEEAQNGLGIQDSLIGVDAEGYDYLGISGGGSMNPTTLDTVHKRMHYIYQEGKVVFKHAVKRMCEAAQILMERNGLCIADIDWLIPHQANLRIIQALQRYLRFPKEKTLVNINKYGNTSAGTIPICLWEFQHRLKKGDQIMMISFGGGFTWAGVLARWAI